MRIPARALASALAAAVAVVCGAARADVSPCSAPLLTAPDSVNAGESYAVSWTGVLPKAATTAADGYEVQRAADPGFTAFIDRIRTARPSQTFGPAPSGLSAVSHRVVVVSPACTTAASAAVVSNVVTTSIRPRCEAPDPVEGLAVSPPDPPALSTYVVSWDTGGSGHPGPGGGESGLTFRLRRVRGDDVKESVFETGSASFQDPPGTYVYQVRAENACGAVGSWSSELTVVVGAAPVPSLAVVSDPRPVAAIAGLDAPPSTSFSVRNTGTRPLAIDVVPGDLLDVSARGFTLGAGETRALTVTARLSYTSLAPYHGAVVLASDAGLLHVPIDVTVAATAADTPVVWSDAEVEIADDGGAVRRTLVNPGATRAAIVSAIGVDWIRIDPTDGGAWDRPLAPGERRTVRINVDRARRRAAFGTETGVISVTTAGFPSSAQRLLVVDDGPAPTVITGVRPAADGAKTRLLYASMPNAKDVHGIGRFTTDLWLTNVDSAAPIDVSIFATPIASSGALVVSSHIDLKLAPGETRRYRNVVSRLMTYDGACEVEVRSPASTLSATAVVANTPIASSSPVKRAALRADGAIAVAAAPVSPGQYGFEMRPTIPGEGVKSSDPQFVLSGLAHDARRRTNVILTETSGVETTVLVALFDTGGHQVLSDGVPVELTVTVPALASVQINDAELFPLPSVDSPYTLLYFQSGGSVMPFATVIDGGTEDASLRVGASVRSLTPVAPPAVASVKRGLAQTAALPFGGGPAPLLFPVAHIRGAALADGSVPYWKTRVTFTNVNESEQRQIQFRIQDQTGNASPGGGFGFIGLSPKASVSIEDVGRLFVTGDNPVYGAIVIDAAETGTQTWQDVDVQTETYTADTRDTALGDYKTGMEGFSYRHGYSSFQSNLGTVQIEGAESSSRFRTNLILEEVGGAPCTVAVSAYTSGSFVPMATATVALPAFGYVSKELFGNVLGLSLTELVDVRVVVRQLDGDGVFMAFASKINLTTGDPANIFLRPASAGTGR